MNYQESDFFLVRSDFVSNFVSDILVALFGGQQVKLPHSTQTSQDALGHCASAGRLTTTSMYISETTALGVCKMQSFVQEASST